MKLVGQGAAFPGWNHPHRPYKTRAATLACCFEGRTKQPLQRLLVVGAAQKAKIGSAAVMFRREVQHTRSDSLFEECTGQ